MTKKAMEKAKKMRGKKRKFDKYVGKTTAAMKKAPKKGGMSFNSKKEMGE